MNEVERAFRAAHGQAVATLTRLFGDIGLAGDAVQDAFVTALSRWPRDGIPDDPAGWIVTTARHRAIDVVRRDRRVRDLMAEVAADRLRIDRVTDEEPPMQQRILHPLLDIMSLIGQLLHVRQTILETRAGA